MTLIPPRAEERALIIAHAFDDVPTGQREPKPATDPDCPCPHGIDGHRWHKENRIPVCPRARRAYRKHRQAAIDAGEIQPGSSAGRPRGTHDHGDHRRYAQGCRCGLCRAAHTAQNRVWRAQRAADPAAADRAGHGKASTYTNYLCRCDLCVAAHSALMAANHQARKRARG
ncbi:hypothetical protein ABZ714_30815 [Streptomyces sp. NPDC006798]|uniref:hypothetical protein n=1 Tax=unclassified Streptomyces TaxID=2593676 RepID=UPI003317FCDA